MYQQLINPATGKPFREVKPDQHMIDLRTQILKQLRNKYDAAQSTHQNQNHWRWADNLSPNSANTLPVRRRLRERSRYEVSNNGYLKGIGLTITTDFAGTGPTLQITDHRFNEDQRMIVEKRFAEYSRQIKLRQLLWRMRFSKFQDGEAFSFVYLDSDYPVKTSYRIYECDQVSSIPEYSSSTQRTLEIDGIRFEKRSGNPSYYHLLWEHPGETEVFNQTMGIGYDGRWISSNLVIHWFRKERPWLRGIPETTSTLPLWALLRRYTLAVVQNAEIAADFTVLLKSLQPEMGNPFTTNVGNPDTTDSEDWFSSFPIDRGLMTVLPRMYDLEQLDPKQPVTMYDTFVNALIQEAARPLLCPRNLALGNSGGYNMSSGTLDRQFYRQAINQERLDCNEEVLDPIFKDFWFEGSRIPDYFDDYYVSPTPVSDVFRKFPSIRRQNPEHCWRWDEVPEHSDPVKVATAIDILHKGGHLSDTDIQETRFNRSVDDHYRNLEKQIEWRNKNMPTQAAADSSGGKDSSNQDIRDEFDDRTE